MLILYKNDGNVRFVLFTKTSNALVFTNFYAMAIFGRKCSHVYFSEDNSICDPEITDNAVFYLEDILSRSNVTKSYTFVVLANVDTTGHGNGWCDTEYNDAVATMDSQVRTDFKNM